VKTFPTEVLKAMKKATDEVMNSYAKKDKLFDEVYTSQMNYMKKAREWTKISEYDYITTTEQVK
jgi:TRAP-type mannitol/chloroaromatic compound transport system substrate-binding protein